MFKLDYFAVLIAIAAIVALSLWPLKSHGEGDHEEDHGDAGRYGEVLELSWHQQPEELWQFVARFHFL